MISSQHLECDITSIYVYIYMSWFPFLMHTDAFPCNLKGTWSPIRNPPRSHQTLSARAQCPFPLPILLHPGWCSQLPPISGAFMIQASLVVLMNGSRWAMTCMSLAARYVLRKYITLLSLEHHRVYVLT